MKKLLPDPELEALIRKLNSSAQQVEESVDDDGPAVAAPQGTPPSRWPLPDRLEEGKQWLEELLNHARKLFASDLLLVVGVPPVVRINGRLQPIGDKNLSAGATELLCAALVPAANRSRVETHGTVDFAYRGASPGRYRCNVHRQRDAWSAAIRLLPSVPLDIQSLGLPDSLNRFTELEHGLVLVTGPTGCGKSTTLAALIRGILERRRVHLVTIEDPVEYEHAHGMGLVEHIEIGRDVDSFAAALRSALRQDPDVLLIGEMRDAESMSIAITAAETGHLVLSTLHTGDSPQTIHRILDSCPADRIAAVRAQLSVSLAGIVSQQLLPRKDGQGRVPAVEILVATPGVRNLIRLGKIEQLRSQITLERQTGMLDLDHSLAQLVLDDLVGPDEARWRARQPSSFDTLLSR